MNPLLVPPQKIAEVKALIKEHEQTLVHKNGGKEFLFLGCGAYSAVFAPSKYPEFAVKVGYDRAFVFMLKVLKECDQLPPFSKHFPIYYDSWYPEIDQYRHSSITLMERLDTDSYHDFDLIKPTKDQDLWQWSYYYTKETNLEVPEISICQAFAWLNDRIKDLLEKSGLSKQSLMSDVGAKNVLIRVTPEGRIPVLTDPFCM